VWEHDLVLEHVQERACALLLARLARAHHSEEHRLVQSVQYDFLVAPGEPPALRSTPRPHTRVPVLLRCSLSVTRVLLLSSRHTVRLGAGARGARGDQIHARPALATRPLLPVRVKANPSVFAVIHALLHDATGSDDWLVYLKMLYGLHCFPHVLTSKRFVQWQLSEPRSVHL